MISLIVATALSTTSLAAKDYQVEKELIRWTGSMPAKTHEGLLTLKSFNVDITNEGTITALTAVVDMTKIDNTDLKGKSRKKLIAHLTSEDFFYVEKYPTATFVLSEHKDDTLYGNITIRGVSRKIALPAKVSRHPDRGWILTGAFDFNRVEFGVDYQNSGLLGLVNAAKSKLIDELIDVDVLIRITPKR